VVKIVSDQNKGRVPILAGAAEKDGSGIGRIRLGHIPDTSRATLNGFIEASVELGNTFVTDGLNAYRNLQGYIHDRHVQRQRPDAAEHLLPGVHRVASLLKR